jgi:hypothetical protein
MASAIPGTLSYFLTLATNTLPSDATVSFGAYKPLFEAPVTLQVTGITGDQEPAELGPNFRREETFSIECDLTSYAGDQLQVNRLTEVFANFALLSVAVANDPTLGSNVRFAEVGDFTYVPGLDAKGQSIGSLTFAIRCSQRIDSLD